MIFFFFFFAFLYRLANHFSFLMLLIFFFFYLLASTLLHCWCPFTTRFYDIFLKQPRREEVLFRLENKAICFQPRKWFLFCFFFSSLVEHFAIALLSSHEFLFEIIYIQQIVKKFFFSLYNPRQLIPHGFQTARKKIFNEIMNVV
jgi:hypothetical protein